MKYMHWRLIDLRPKRPHARNTKTAAALRRAQIGPFVDPQYDSRDIPLARFVIVSADYHTTAKLTGPDECQGVFALYRIMFPAFGIRGDEFLFRRQRKSFLIQRRGFFLSMRVISKSATNQVADSLLG